MKHLLRSLFMLILSCCIASSYGQIYSYTNSTTGAVASVAANATGTALTRVNAVAAPATPCGTGYSATNYAATTTYATTLGAVQAAATANTGYLLSVTSFSADLRRSGSGPASVRLAYSTDHGATWIDKGSNDAPNNAGCGTTTTATWTTSFTVPADSTLQFRIYGFNASATSGTFQVLNLLINGTVVSANSITTSAASFGPFCQSSSDTIAVPFTKVGTFTDSFRVQLSDASGVFPSNATSNLIGAGTTSPITAVIPAGTAAGAGYRVRVVNTNTLYLASGDNGSDIAITAPVAPAVNITSTQASVCPGTAITFSIASATNGGNNPLFAWYLNNTAVSTGPSYTLSTPANNDSVRVQLTSDRGCTTTTTAFSTAIGVVVYPTAATDVYDTLCPGGSVVFDGNTQTTSGNYVAHLTTVHGCDSAVTLHLYVKPLLTSAVSASICQGDAYTFGGHSYTTAGSYNDTVRCDSIVTLTLSYKTVHTSTASGSFCRGDVYTFNSHSYTAAGTFNDTIRCDSIVTLTLTYKTVRTYTASAAICAGDVYTFNGHSYTTAGTFNDTVRCDSLVVLTISYKTVRTSTASAVICQGDQYTFHGHTYSAAGTYTDSIRCDSAVILTISYKALHITSLNADICQGAAYSFGGHSYTVAGTYSDTVRCDSIVTLVLAVNANPTATVSGSGAALIAGGTGSYQWLLNGAPVSGATSQTYTATQNGDYSVVVTNNSGCSDTSSVQSVTGVGISETDALSAVVYPIPTTGVLHIQATGIQHIELIDLVGRTLLTEDLTRTADHAQLDLSGYGSGMYTLILRGADNAVSIKNIIKK